MSATVAITWRCSGCDAKVEADRQLITRRFRGASGRDYGVGSWFWDEVEVDATYPAEWTKDPLTCADYCPKCADEIWPDEVAAEHVGGTK